MFEALGLVFENGDTMGVVGCTVLVNGMLLLLSWLYARASRKRYSQGRSLFPNVAGSFATCALLGVWWFVMPLVSGVVVGEPSDAVAGLVLALEYLLSSLFVLWCLLLVRAWTKQSHSNHLGWTLVATFAFFVSAMYLRALNAGEAAAAFAETLAVFSAYLSVDRAWENFVWSGRGRPASVLWRLVGFSRAGERMVMKGGCCDLSVQQEGLLAAGASLAFGATLFLVGLLFVLLFSGDAGMLSETGVFLVCSGVYTASRN